ncbi:MAG: PilZ domain-containing protein [Motiliproteus sp.]
MKELRLHPRIPTQLMADVTNSNGETLPAKVVNLSPGGLMLLGDEPLKHLVFAGQDPEKDPLFHPVEVEIRIPLPGQLQPFYSRIRLLYIRRLSQNEYNMGFRYVAISSIHTKMMERHIFPEGQNDNGNAQFSASI